MPDTCQTHVRHMTDTCHTHAIHMSDTCHTHVIRVSYTCLTHVRHMSYTCRTHVIHMSHTCHIHMSLTCHAHVIHMSYTCHTHGQPGGAKSFIANSVQGHAPLTNLSPGHAGAIMPRRDEVMAVMGPGPWDVGWSAAANRPHPLEEGGARWRTRSSDRSVNMQDDDWHRRLEKTQAAVSAIQETDSYRALWRKLPTLEAWGGHPCESAFPKPPDCTDRLNYFEMVMGGSYLGIPRGHQADVQG